MNRERLIYILMICQEFSTLPLDAVESIFGKLGYGFLPFDLKVGPGLVVDRYGGDVDFFASQYLRCSGVSLHSRQVQGCNVTIVPCVDICTCGD